MIISEEKGSWKDSNWYVSFKGFWDEFKRHKIGIIGLAILVFYVGMAVSAPYLATHDPKTNNTVAPKFLAPSWMSVFDPEGVITREYMPDPTLEQEPTFHINGTNQDEFSYNYYQSDETNGTNKAELLWTHSPGAMDFPDPLLSKLEADERPPCNDFVYFTQSFEWPYEARPGGVNMTFSYALDYSGSFASEADGVLMFRAYIYLIDSSDNWWQIRRTSPAYKDEIQEFTFQLGITDVSEGWNGMIERDGDQEDPTDDLTVAVVLSPTSNFAEWKETEPQMSYSGTVNLTVTEITMLASGNYFGLLGTTDKGADAWSQLVYGSRVSLIVGVMATALSSAVGVIVGLTAGYFGGKVDEFLMRLVDFLLVIPSLPLMMVLARFLGRSVENIIFVIAILGWTGTSRLIRSQVLAEKNKAYVESARAIGASDTYIMFRHILPNVTPILFANITLGVVGAILSESGLAFLGLTDPMIPSWGRMLADAQGSPAINQGAWWLVIFPGVAITTLSLAFTFVGHTLDQILNPKLRER